MIEKKLHPLSGAELRKEGNNYVLEFKEFKEKDVHSSWDSLSKRMEELYKNEIEE